MGFWPWVGVQQDRPKGDPLGVIGTDPCSQWGSK